MVSPGSVRKAKCGWRKSEEEQKREIKVISDIDAVSSVAQLCQAFAGDTDVGSGESPLPCW